MTPRRIGTVEYLNTIPLLRGLEAVEGVECVRAVPARVIDLLLSGRVDVALVSLIDIARSPKPLTVLPVGMIGCDGPTLTVRLFSSGPIEAITRVHADTDSHTSVVLARLLLKKRHGIDPQFIDFDAREHVSSPADPAFDQWPPAVLLIGDKVVSNSPPAVRYPHQLDLGAAWREMTGLPFVYAVWACQADRSHEPGIHSIATLLDRVRRRNGARPDQIVNEAANDHGWPADLAREYVGRLLRYDFGLRERDAASRFLVMAADAGYAPPATLDIRELADFVPTPG